MGKTIDIEWRIKNDVEIDPVVVEEMRERMELLSTLPTRDDSVERMLDTWIAGFKEGVKDPSSESISQYHGCVNTNSVDEDTDTWRLDLSFCIGSTTVYNGKKYTITNTVNTKEFTPEQIEEARADVKTFFDPTADNVFLFLESEDGEKKVLLFTNVQLKGGKI